MQSKILSLRAKKNYLLVGFEKKYVDELRHFFMRFQTNQLTLATILWSLLTIGFAGLLASTGNRAWLLGISLTIILQYLTDHFDGYVGRAKGTGLVRWGYFMDHLLDHIFLCSVFLGYLFLLPQQNVNVAGLALLVFAGLMMHVFFRYLTTGELNISYCGIGPTEIRIGTIILNVFIVLFGAGLLAVALKVFCCAALLLLCLEIIKSHKKIVEPIKYKAPALPRIMAGFFMLFSVLMIVSAPETAGSTASTLKWYVEICGITTIIIQVLLSSESLRQGHRNMRLDIQTAYSLILLGVVFLATIFGRIISIHPLIDELSLFALTAQLNYPLIFGLAILFAFNVFSIQRKLWQMDTPQFNRHIKRY